MIKKIYAYNRQSPVNEDEYIKAYKKLNPSAALDDGYDISCVTTITGINGHGLMDESDNRSKDSELHIVFDFISDSELRANM